VQPIAEQAALKARQGVGNAISERIRVVDANGRTHRRTAATMGRDRNTRQQRDAGYYNDDEATRNAAPDGWFRTGDLGVMCADGYIALRDRAKDIIISGGENISSIEVEEALTSHPRRSRGGRRRRSRRKMGRGSHRVHHAQGRGERDGGGVDRTRARATRTFQGAQARGLRAASEDSNRQSAEEDVARPASHLTW
jgi:hypothetical protein